MIPDEKGQKAPRLRLLPHQAALVETFFNPTSKRVILLRGDVGLGKSRALVALAGRVLQERPMARVLILVPAALRLQFMAMLREDGTPSLLVDRYRFREMLDSTTGSDFWPRGKAAVLSLEFANQPDIRDSLADTNWDLVIADEAHPIHGTPGETLRKVGASAMRVVLASATDMYAAGVFPAEDITCVHWQRDQLVDYGGRPLDSVGRPLLHEVTFRFSPAELNLRKTVRKLCKIIRGGSKAEDLWAKALLRGLASSPAALEDILRRMEEEMSGLDSEDKSDDFLEEDLPKDRKIGRMNRNTIDKAAEVAHIALQKIEDIADDSKLEAFGALLSHLNEAKKPSQRICVLTHYLASLYYLASEIEGRGLAYSLLQGGMSDETRGRSLSAFSSTGAILIASIAAMTAGLSLAGVSDLVLYDIPSNKIVLQRVLSRFDRFGRSSRLNVYVLTPSNSSDSIIIKPLNILRNLLGSPIKPKSKH